MRRVADLLDKHAPELARIETTDNGKIIRDAAAQTASLSATYHYLAGAF